MFAYTPNQTGFLNTKILIYLIVVLLLVCLFIFFWFIFDYIRRRMIYKRELKELEEIEKLGNGIGHNTLLKVLATPTERSKKSKKAVRFSKICAQLNYKRKGNIFGDKFDPTKSISSSSSSGQSALKLVSNGQALKLASSGLDPVLDVVNRESKSTTKLKKKNQLDKPNPDQGAKKKVASINKPNNSGSAGVSNLESNDNLSSKTYRSLLSTRSDPNFKEDGFSIKLEGYLRDNELTKKLDKYLKDKNRIEDQLFKADLNDNAEQYLNPTIQNKLHSTAQKHTQINQTMADNNQTSLISAIKPADIEPAFEINRKQSEDALFTLSTAYEPELLHSKMIASMISIKNKQQSSFEPTLSEFIAAEPERSRIEYKVIKLEPVVKESDKSLEPLKVIEPKLDTMPKSEQKANAIDQLLPEPKADKAVEAKLNIIPKLEYKIDKVPAPKLAKVIEPKVVEPKVVEPKVVEPKVVEPKVREPKIIEPKVMEPKLVKTPKLKYKTGEISKVPETYLIQPKTTDQSRTVEKKKSKDLVHFKPKKGADQLAVLKAKVDIVKDIKLKVTKDQTKIIASEGIKETQPKIIKQDQSKDIVTTKVLKNFYDSNKIKDPTVTIKRIKATKIGKDIKMIKQPKSFKVIKKFKVKPKQQFQDSPSLDLHHSDSSSDEDSVRNRSRRSTISKTSETDISLKK